MTTAVPYAQISVPMPPNSLVSNRIPMIALAPSDCASSVSRSIACLPPLREHRRHATQLAADERLEPCTEL